MGLNFPTIGQGETIPHPWTSTVWEGLYDDSPAQTEELLTVDGFWQESQFSLRMWAQLICHAPVGSPTFLSL